MSRCLHCRHIWLNPRPTFKDISKVYQNYYTHGVTAPGNTFQKHIGNHKAIHKLTLRFSKFVQIIEDSILAVRFGYDDVLSRPFAKLIVWTFGLLPGMANTAKMRVFGLHGRERGRLLDIGCGNGENLARLSSLGWDVVGHESDPKAARFARENFGLDVREGSLNEAILESECFDVIILSHVIEHIHSPVEFINEIKNLLKPSGKLIILTPNSNGLGHIYFKDCWRGLEPPRHINCFNIRTLISCVVKADMNVSCSITLSRMTKAIWYTSLQIKRCKFQVSEKNNIYDYLLSYLMHTIVIFALILFNEIGEEIYLVATPKDKKMND